MLAVQHKQSEITFSANRGIATNHPHHVLTHQRKGAIKN